MAVGWTIVRHCLDCAGQYCLGLRKAASNKMSETKTSQQILRSGITRAQPYSAIEIAKRRLGVAGVTVDPSSAEQNGRRIGIQCDCSLYRGERPVVIAERAQHVASGTKGLRIVIV
jgi:hypothetical protein